MKFEVEALPHVPRELLPYIDRWTVQEPQALDLQIVQAMQEQMDAGVAWLLKAGLTYVFLRRATPWVGQVHVYNLGTPFGLVRGFRAITDAALAHFPRLEARFHERKLRGAIERCGWTYEGTFEKSYCTESGDFLDEYGYGVTRWDR